MQGGGPENHGEECSADCHEEILGKLPRRVARRIAERGIRRLNVVGLSANGDLVSDGPAFSRFQRECAERLKVHQEDMALYEAKNSGRNRVVVASADKGGCQFDSSAELDA